MHDAPFDLGSIRLLRRSGQGSTADVWRGVHRPSGAAVAVKILRTDAAPRLADFAREVRAVAGLDHPAIIRVHDYGTLPAEPLPAEPLPAEPLPAEPLPADAPYLVMDWHAGGTLHDHLGTLDFPSLRTHLLTVLDALAHAHARGVVHRDLKPANVLLGDNGAVLTDFGVVFSMHDPGDLSRAPGTPNYMAPEQVTNDWRAFGPATDLYALGCVAWALSTGKAPYTGAGARQAMRGHLSGQPPPFVPRVDVPEGFEGWLRRLLRRDPTRRHRFAADAHAALLALTGLEQRAAVVAPEPTALAPEDMTLGSTGADRTAPNHPTVPAPSAAEPHEPAPWPGPRFSPDGWRTDVPADALRLSDCGRILAELRTPPLRGRSSAQGFLWRRLGEVRGGGGARAVVLDGPGGAGKSALSRWLAVRAHETGHGAALAVNHRPGTHDGGQLETALLRRLRLDGLDPDSAFQRGRERVGLEPWTAAALVAMTRPDRTASFDGLYVGLPTEQAVFAALADGLTTLAGERAVVVLLDDVHWSARALRFTRFVLRRRPTVPALFVIAMRGDLTDDGVARQLDALKDLPTVDRRPLAPLGDDALDQALDDRLALAPETRRRLLRTVRGDLRFAAELIRHWVRADALVADTDGHRLRDDRPALWPPSPADLGRMQLDQLAFARTDVDDPLPALELAAVLGREVDEREWASARGFAPLARPDATVEHMLDDGMLRVSGPGRLVFARGSVRTALLQRARDAGRLARWHRICVRALDALGPDGRAGDPVRCAGHLDAAGRPAEAFTRWQAAIALARERGAEMTLALTPTLLGAARAARRMRLSRRDPRWLGLLISWSARCNFAARGSGLRHARRALAGALQTDDLGLRARAERHVGRTLIQQGRYDEARSMLAQAMATDRRAGARSGEALTYQLYYLIAMQRGDLDEAARMARAALINTEAHNARQLPNLFNALGEIARNRGALDEAAEHYRQALDALGERDVAFRAVPELNLALIDLARGDLDDADERAERAARSGDRFGDRVVRIYSETIRLVVAAERGAAGPWDRAWAALSAALIGGLRDREHAGLLVRAYRGAQTHLPTRADAARALAVARLRDLGAEDEAARIESEAAAETG